MGKSICFVNGEFLDEKEAVISVFDHGFLYGDGIFEAFRVHSGKIFQLDAHMDRLYDSAKIIDLEIPLEKQEFKKIIIEAVKKSEYKDCYIRPQVTRGVGALGHDPGTCEEPTVVVYVTPTPLTKKGRTIKTIVSAYRRPPAFVLPPESKTTHYLNNILAKMEAKKKGVDDAILLDIRGFVSEGCGWNVFLVKNGSVSTPSITSSILKGITREVVIHLLKELNIQVQERDISLSELLAADEVFGTGTASEISPIIEINGRKIGDGGPGLITNRIEEKFKEFIEENGTPL